METGYIPPPKKPGEATQEPPLPKARIVSMVVKATCRRSHEYQSAEASAETVIEFDRNDRKPSVADVRKYYAAAHKELSLIVDRAAEAALYEILNPSDIQEN